MTPLFAELDCARLEKGVKQLRTFLSYPVQTHENERPAAIYRVADLVVDTGRATVVRDGLEIALPRLSLDFLVALIEAAPRVVSQAELMDRVWPGLVVGPETVSQRVKLLRDSLGDDPRKPRYVAGIRGRGYRLLPDVVRVDAVARAIAAAPSAAPPSPVPSRRPWPLLIAACILVAVAGIAALLLGRDRTQAPDSGPITATPLPARSVAVLAFENRGGAAGTDVLADGIPENVLHQLGRFPGLIVIARGSSFAFRGSREDLRVIGRKLNVRYLLEGSVQTAGDRLRVTSSLVDAETGASVWSMQFERAQRDIFAVQDEIALEVARAMKLSIDEGAATLARGSRDGTRDYEGYLAFLRGRALLANQRVADLPAAVESLTAAIRQDPGLAPAYVLLARARTELAERDTSGQAQAGFAKAVGESLQLIDKAIELDPGYGEAFVERGYLKAYFDIAAADADLRRGIELAPNYARGYEGLAAVQFQSAARRNEALALIDKARRLDPLEPRLEVVKATYLGYGPGDSKQATAILQSLLDRNPLYVPALVRLAEFRWSLESRPADTILLDEQAVALDPGNETAWRQLAVAYLDVDEPASAEASLRHIGESSRTGHLSLYLYRRNWRAAGDAAYAALAAGPVRPIDERRTGLAIRMHARETGEYARAIRALEAWMSVEWEDGEPTLGDQLSQGTAVAGLADVLLIAGQPERARSLAESLLADIEVQVRRYGRSEIWVDHGRAMALALLGRPEQALTALQRLAKSGFGLHDWKMGLADEPVFQPLRNRTEFQTILAAARANAAREKQRLARMRADGLVPDRR